MEMTIEELRKSGWIAYEYRRGSHMYHLNTETSDEDTGGVFIVPKDYLLGLRSEYPEQIADEKNDTVFYEFGRWIELLIKSNPTALESLFAPEDCIIGDVHPAVQFVIDNRDMFLSKECFKTFYGYAVSQITKARGLNKKIVNPMTERKGILDFCYTFKGQGSQPFKDYLNSNGLKQEYCGLVNVPNMNEMYAVFYDWGNHRENEGFNGDMIKFVNRNFPFLKDREHCFGAPPIGYRGVVSKTGDESNEVRLSSVEKGSAPLCWMQYGKNAYESHCRAYREYKDWEKRRNPVRYEGNLGHNYDAKNIMHCMRLIRMSKELAQGKGFNVVRTFDRDFLLDIRNHKFEYEDVMKFVEDEKAEMENAIKTCTLPDNVNYDNINKLLIDARKKQYNID